VLVETVRIRNLSKAHKTKTGVALEDEKVQHRMILGLVGLVQTTGLPSFYQVYKLENGRSPREQPA